MPVSEKTYQQVALEDPSGRWELYCGELRRKPGMTMEHNYFQEKLGFVLRLQLGRSRFRLRTDASRAEISASTYFIPDLFVVPAELELARQGQPQTLETYAEPLPLVVEVWSRSTGEYDVMAKLPEYQRRGDLEIWLVHPYEHTITAWRRQPDGSYIETFHDSGAIEPAHLPGVRIDLSDLFALD
jgi:Uma2 family endonuclease